METGMKVAKKRDKSENYLSEDKMPPNASDYFLPQQAIRTENTLEDIEEAEEHIECDSEELRYGAGDALFAALIVTPQVVSVWRGTWGLMELQAKLFPNVQIFVLGITIHVCFALVRSYLLSRSKNAWGEEARAGRWVRERVLCRIYTYIFALSNIMHWRGGFGLLDSLIRLIVPSNDNYYRGLFYAVFTMSFYIAMVSFRSSRTLLAPPYFVVTDGKEFTYVFSTRFQKKEHFTLRSKKRQEQPHHGMEHRLPR